MRIAIDAGRFLAEPGRKRAERNARILVDGDVHTVGPGAGNGDLVMPAPVNAHDHGYGVRSLDCGVIDDALEVWIPGLRLRPRTDPYLEALVAFGRIALGGVGATVHCHNSHNTGRLIEEAAAVVRAAGDVGIRLGLSCPLLDDNAWVYGGPENLRGHVSGDEWNLLSPAIPRYRPAAEQIAAVDAIADAHHGGLVDVQYGPIGPQWCSDQLLEMIAEASAHTGRRIHMHLLESLRQRDWLDGRYPQGIVRHLDEIGLLSPRLAVAHGVQLRPDECDLLAERGVIVVSNPSANLRLRSGFAPVATFAATGPEFAFGLDGSGFDDDQDLWRELRLAWLLHGGQGLMRTFTAEKLFDAAIRNGAAVVNQPSGRDLAVIDYAALTEDALFDDIDEAEVLLTRMSRAYVKGLVVSGREVVHDRRLTGIDFGAAQAELRAQARADVPRLLEERRRSGLLADATRRFYAA
jgi:5-methylthioadenosine/S-adenosylhomocysteine deaminase